MIYKDKERVGRFYVGSTPVAAIYLGAVKVWEAISSCFGSGRWRPDRIWKGTDKWKLN